MSTRTLIRLTAGMVLALAALTACGGGDGMHFTIERGNWPNWPWPWSRNADFVAKRDFFREVQVMDNIGFRLDTVNGEIAITGQPDATSVVVTAERRVGSNESQKDAEEKLAQLEVLVTDRSDEILVQTRQPTDAEGRQYVVDYTVTVPSDLEVTVIQTNGAVRIEGIANSVLVETLNGNIDSTLSLPLNAEVWLSTINGDLDLRIPTITSAKLSAFVDNGTITWDNLELLDALHTNRSLTGTLGDGAGLIDLETTNGDIDVTGFDE